MEEQNKVTRFTELNLSPELIEGIESFGFENATPVQEKVIPEALKGSDILACAQTGTGKTAAFLIPLVEKFLKKPDHTIKCIILVPTRELAIQIEQNLTGLLYFTDLACCAIYGGQDSGDFSQQKQAITSGTDFIIATPGRLIAHINLGYMNFSNVDTFVLDEADRMLDMGFIEDILKIHKNIPKTGVQHMMFSATMAISIRKLANNLMKEPVQINLAIAKPAAGINQQAYMVFDEHKIELLLHLLQGMEVKNMIVFVALKTEVDKLYGRLVRKGIAVESIHSGKLQTERNEALRLFKSGQLKVLIATDILSRGIDIDELSHVVNFNIPDDPADYVHRIGRTARAGKSGAAISFINEADQFKWQNIEQLIENSIEKMLTPTEIGSSPEYNPQKFGRNKRGGFNKGKGGNKNFKKPFNKNKSGSSYSGSHSPKRS